MNERQLLEQFRQTPEGQRLLQAIRFAEGTAGPKGYQTMFGGGTFSDLSKHPDTVISSGGYKSAAAGAYQFMPYTWGSYASRLGLGSFGPKEQDIAALALARDKLMKIGGLAALKQEGLSPRVAAALSPAWASFPTESGKSYYGQPVKSLSSIQEVYGRVPSPVVQDQSTTETSSVSPVSIPRFDFKGALKNIVSEFATKTEQPASTGDQATKYLELANALDEQGITDLAEKYRAEALSASMESVTPNADPTALATQILQAKLTEKVFNQQAEALESQLNKSIGAQPMSTGALTPSGGTTIPGVQITSAVDTSGEPGFDFVIPGGRGAAFNLPFKAQVLKVVNDPWETNLEKGPGRRGYGNYVDLRGVDPQTGRAFDVRLAHFDKLNPGLKPGAVIDPGTFIGTQGRSGSTTGAHVSADFYNPGENKTSPEVLKIGYQIRDRLAKGQPVF
ncbi:MAG: hypothetical protein FJ184_00075 [Gammaproteobacteria bacterium]|nr:hypothetical protein [Gammaproteobacteria bacterium]